MWRVGVSANAIKGAALPSFLTSHSWSPPPPQLQPLNTAHHRCRRPKDLINILCFSKLPLPHLSIVPSPGCFWFHLPSTSSAPAVVVRHCYVESIACCRGMNQGDNVATARCRVMMFGSASHFSSAHRAHRSPSPGIVYYSFSSDCGHTNKWVHLDFLHSSQRAIQTVPTTIGVRSF
jgi:hypothetical protein